MRFLPIMFVRKSQLTTGGSWMVKVVCLFVCNPIGVMQCNKDTLKTSHSPCNMSREVFIVTRRLARMVPSIEINWKAFSR